MRALVFAALVALAGCGGDNSPATPPPDMARGPDLYSACGHPGDVGNSLGVGKYCTKLSDCSMNKQATLCTILGSDDTFFCTFSCSGPTSTECGEAASCQCQGTQCGCFPDACK